MQPRREHIITLRAISIEAVYNWPIAHAITVMAFSGNKPIEKYSCGCKEGGIRGAAMVVIQELAKDMRKD